MFCTKHAEQSINIRTKISISILYYIHLPAKIRCCHSTAGRTNNDRNSNVMQSKQLSTIDTAGFDAEAVAIICAGRWSQIYGIWPLIEKRWQLVICITCKQKQTLLLYMRRMVWETRLIGLLLGLPFSAN